MATEERDGNQKAHEAIIRFGGAFILHESTNDDGETTTTVVFPNSRPISAPAHDPYLIFAEKNLNPDDFISRLHHRLLPNEYADPTVVLNLHGEDQMWNKLPRLIEVIPDGKKLTRGPEIDRTASLYDLSRSGIKSITQDRSKLSAEVAITGGTLRAFQETPNEWVVGGSKARINFMDALEWRVPFSGYLDIILADEGSENSDKTITLVPNKYSREAAADATINIAFSCFPPWHAEYDHPHYSILETLVELGSAILWPTKAGPKVPGTHCPNGYLKT